LIRPEEINRAYERVVSKDVRYRFVIGRATAMAFAREGASVVVAHSPSSVM
jgi:hypothetical protein